MVFGFSPLTELGRKSAEDHCIYDLNFLKWIKHCLTTFDL
jgi:hypothetical protein